MNAQHPTNAPVPQGDFVSIAPAVVERLLGEPSSRSARELRWGRKGSFRLKLDTGTWSDFEAGEGGGVLALVMREERLDKSGALAWLETQGFLSSSSGRDKIGAYGAVSGKTIARESPHSPANQGSTTMTPARSPKETLRWIRRQILPIADASDHPIRAWMRRRNLWRPELPLPPSLRWIAADAPVFRRTHSGAGAIAFPLAPVSAWRASYPDTPSPTAVQLVCIDAMAREQTIRTPRAIAWTSRSSATPDLPYGPSGMSAATESWSARELRMHWRSPQEKPTQ